MLKRPSHFSNAGFTLVELVMVLVLLGILAVVALPKFSGRSEFDERVFFDDVLNAIRYAQKSAVATGCNVRFEINNNQYQLIRDDSCSSSQFTSTLPVRHPGTGESSYVGSQTNVSLSATNTQTTFDSLGRADADNLIQVGPRQITLIAQTGFCYDSTP
jgi:MSHA pilin protein MshC